MCFLVMSHFSHDTRDGMIHRCIAILQYDTGIDTTFNVLIYIVYRNNRMH